MPDSDSRDSGSQSQRSRGRARRFKRHREGMTLLSN